MIRARLEIPVTNKSMSRSLVVAVQPDNVRMKGLKVDGLTANHRASFRLEFDGKIETFISTVDDLLRCLQAGKETLRKIAR